MKPRILYLSPNGYLGGAERVVLNVLRGHAERAQIEARALSFSEGDAVDAARASGLRWDVLSPVHLSDARSLMRARTGLLRYCATHAVQVVHAAMPWGQLISLAGTLGNSVRRVWFQHGPVGGLLDKLACWTMPDAILYNSQYTRDEHLRYDHVNRWRRVHHMIRCAIHTGPINPERVAAIRQEHVGESQRRLLLTAGRLCRWKGFEIAIDAMSILCQRLPSAQHPRLLIAGGANSVDDTNYEAELKQRVATHRLVEQVRFVGNQPSLQDYYEAADCCLHCSTSPEPFGLVVGEAMLHHALVLGSSRGGVRDLLVHGETGFSYDTSARDAAQRLAALLETFVIGAHERGAEFDTVRRRAFEKVSTTYTSDSMAEALESIYDDLLNRTLARSRQRKLSHQTQGAPPS